MKDALTGIAMMVAVSPLRTSGASGDRDQRLRPFLGSVFEALLESFAASASRAAHRSLRLLGRRLGPALLDDMG